MNWWTFYLKTRLVSLDSPFLNDFFQSHLKYKYIVFLKCNFNVKSNLFSMLLPTITDKLVQKGSLFFYLCSSDGTSCVLQFVCWYFNLGRTLMARRIVGFCFVSHWACFAFVPFCEPFPSNCVNLQKKPEIASFFFLPYKNPPPSSVSFIVVSSLKSGTRCTMQTEA